ncbi:DUF262 domain-containing protein [Nesterenkonia sp. NBAIMH1]|uniref:GmrSD restriction endonuclease domain-containing protein n=1 Tax=Nesterenkonia sp. NBAIMH1 TaxID=2600320 RepID=UPI00143D5806|nr:DUF262 domain-containing protein [Nesterenkonia sp. NBAIMH1]
MVKAQEVSLQKILEGSYQFQVPLYQRPYQWSKGQWDVLWTDILRLAQERHGEGAVGANHFIGSLVLAPAPGVVAGGLTKFMVVDGQQRLTTLTLVLAAIRDHILASGEEGALRRASRLEHTFLVNQYEEGPEYYKLLPTQQDRDDYTTILDQARVARGNSRIVEAYQHFASLLDLAEGDEETPSVKEIEDAVSHGLSLVSISTEHDDNVYRIFESLNNTGLKLTQGDLVRNHLFMRLPTRSQELYDRHWRSLQRALENEHIETMLWIDLVRRDPVARFKDTYARQRLRLETMRTEDEVAEEVKRLAHLGALYRLAWHPEEESHAGVRRQLTRLLDWGATVTDPPVLQLLIMRDQGRATSEEIAQAMLLIESYLVRRILAGRASQGINRQLATLSNELYEDTTGEPADVLVRNYLTRQVRQFVSDQGLRNAAGTSAFYYSGRAKQRKQVLLWLEELFNSQERIDPDDLTIEHVMPQTLSAEWEQSLAEHHDEVAERHTALVHTLGNLTLTGYNAPQSNRPFAEKQAYLRGTSLKMSQEIADESVWTFDSIEARTDRLIDLAVQYWPGPLEGIEPAPDKEHWVNLRFILSEMPTGTWTTYGDLAAAIGVSAQSVGNYLAHKPASNPHRVLKTNGAVSDQFAWVGDNQSVDPRDLLQDEGITFDSRGRADAKTRLRADALVELMPGAE